MAAQQQQKMTKGRGDQTAFNNESKEDLLDSAKMFTGETGLLL